MFLVRHSLEQTGAEDVFVSFFSRVSMGFRTAIALSGVKRFMAPIRVVFAMREALLDPGNKAAAGRSQREQ